MIGYLSSLEVVFSFVRHVINQSIESIIHIVVRGTLYITNMELEVVGHFQKLLFILYTILFVSYNLWEIDAAWLLTIFHVIYGIMSAHILLLRSDDDHTVDITPNTGEVISTSILVHVHWLFPILPLLIIGIQRPIISRELGALAWILFTIGAFYHFVADFHRSLFFVGRNAMIALKESLPQEVSNSIDVPPNFITSHLWAISRHPNYFGELLIHLSYCTCSCSMLPIYCTLAMILLVWLPVIHRIEERLSYNAEYREYQQKTAKIIPFIY